MFGKKGLILGLALILLSGWLTVPGVANPEREMGVDIWTNRNLYQIGESIEIQVRIWEPAYIYIFDVDAQGKVRLIFPNQHSPFNCFGSGVHTFPDGPYTLRVTPPSGTEYIHALVFQKELPIIPGKYQQYLTPNFRDPERFTKWFWMKTRGIVPPQRWGAAWTSFRVGRPRNKPPRAGFEYYPSVPRPGTRINFDASTSFDPDGHIVKYEWDFGNDDYFDASGLRVSEYFHFPGSYRITLTVTDNQGATDCFTRIIEVGALKPGFYLKPVASNRIKITIRGAWATERKVRVHLVSDGIFKSIKPQYISGFTWRSVLEKPYLIARGAIKDGEIKFTVGVRCGTWVRFTLGVDANGNGLLESNEMNGLIFWHNGQQYRRLQSNQFRINLPFQGSDC